jgi:hypothetical protein
VVPLTLVERGCCAADYNNCEWWGQLAIKGRSVGRVSGEESRRKNRGVYKSNWRNACTQNLRGFSDKTEFQT